MPITFNDILLAHGVPPDRTRLLRHKDASAKPGRTPYDLWRNDHAAFMEYQSVQRLGRRLLQENGLFWAAFVATPAKEDLFAGLWISRYLGPNPEAARMPHMDGEYPPFSQDRWELTSDDRMNDLIGRLIIDWGNSALAFIQYAQQGKDPRLGKPVVEIRRAYKEPEFPGFFEFVSDLSSISSMPLAWRAVLTAARGIYLLTCPRTKEQYVGSATGQEGFMGRWNFYIANGHGGNVGLKSREMADYQVSILEVSGSAATADEILGREALWKKKLQSREMGLNRN